MIGSSLMSIEEFWIPIKLTNCSKADFNLKVKTAMNNDILLSFLLIKNQKIIK